MKSHTSEGIEPADVGPVMCVVGARPNFMKMAPVLRAMAAHRPQVPAILVHTGQHYDAGLSDQLFADLQLPQPEYNLGVGSGTHAGQTAEVMRKFEPVMDAHHPSCVAVVGDVNSTLACALVAAKKGIPVAHIEAGLRSGDRSMPEEINRILTDQLADRLYTTERSASANLELEGIPSSRIVFAGNVMIDSVLFSLPSARLAKHTLHDFHVDPDFMAQAGGYGVVTLHRPSNVDHPDVLGALMDVLREVAKELPLVFAVHPRTRRNIERFGLLRLVDPKRMVLLPPLGYLGMLGLMVGAHVVLTDSGGLQEEATALGIPCLTLRENTERPITVEQGTNIVVGRDRVAIVQAVREICSGKGKRGRVPEFWDGQAAQRIVADLHSWLYARCVANPPKASVL